MKKTGTEAKKNVDILIVEDSRTQAEQLKHLLEKNLYIVVAAENGSQALKMVDQYLPKVIISDICMPGMDGYELCRRVKAMNLKEEIPVILLTSLSNMEDVIEGLECGADNFITKPYAKEYLLSHVEQIIANRKLNRTERVRIGVEILFGGKRRFITADQQQMLTLLISTYEAAVTRNRELTKMQEELQTMNDQLEEMVEERTMELRINEEKYLDLYHNAPTMFISVQYPEQKVIECNETLLRKTGFKRTEVIGEPIFSRYHPDCLEKVRLSINIFNETGELKNQELDLLTSLGGKIPVLVNSSSVRDYDGKILHSRTVLQDISELKMIQEKLRQSEECYRAVADSAVDSIITADDAGIIVGWNQGANKTFGYDEAEIAGQPVTMIIPESYFDLHLGGFKRIHQEESYHMIGKTVELHGKRKNGEIFPIELSLAQWKTSTDRFFTGIIRDITERTITEKELMKAKEKAIESDQLKSAFLANMSHEIRTPMNGILGFSQLLKDKDLSDQRKEEYIDAIDKSTHQLLHIITDILDISKIEAGQETARLVDFNLIDLLDELQSFFQMPAQGKNLKLTFYRNLPETLVNIKSDPVKLRQTLNNLIGNALKFTDQGGIEIHVTHENQRLIFKVKDTGIGIKPSLQEAIFDRFRQVEVSIARKYGGTGLGLSLVKSYAEMLNGNIRVDSAPGKGSTFTFEIPLIRASVIKTEKKAEKKELTYNNAWKEKTILIAEDEEANLFYLKTVLRATGIKIIAALNGLEAVEQCKNHPEIEVALMDIKMPEMDGMTATRIIKSFRPKLPVIATTAYALSSDREKCLEAGCVDYLPKPIIREQMISMIADYLK